LHHGPRFSPRGHPHGVHPVALHLSHPLEKRHAVARHALFAGRAAGEQDLTSTGPDTSIKRILVAQIERKSGLKQSRRNLPRRILIRVAVAMADDQVVEELEQPPWDTQAA